jgi:DTW domain-containing protein YfiP
MHVPLCVCAAIPRLDLGTRLLLIMHRCETGKSTNTGNLALKALCNSELRVHGRSEAPLDLSDLDYAERRVLFLFPSDDAVPLTRELVAGDRRPVTLVVPDGNWRQAGKIGRRVPGLERAQRVSLPEGARTRYRLRSENRPGGLATFEAISRAIGILETVEDQTQLDGLFDLMVERTLMTRGATERSPSGIATSKRMAPQ